MTEQRTTERLRDAMGEPCCMSDAHGQACRCRATGWQPIETAPKDTPVLLAFSEGIIEGTLIGGEWWDVVPLSQHGCGCCSDDTSTPHHWMPLPQPPEDTQ